MASMLSNYIKKEQLLKQLQEELQALENNSELKKELEFKEKLQALMIEHGKEARDVCEILDPTYLKAPTKVTNTVVRQQRPLKVYKNPYTGQVVETRGGNHKVIQEWKAEYGNEEIVNWLLKEKA
ncbi:histone-like nucleoid-structuring protein, MvaT/MvaU family [Vreelandella populi]|uniref:H-NS histone n=1 Tax=Vreelandella populi TaxID=2498858 RepID=A0A3S0ZCA6_9GAMM|nr:histone-like nucleoid-structuring protein, MvaT/MvaU family [Halomonas populi]RUR43591.1 H-NS histone [Halomonas populi]